MQQLSRASSKGSAADLASIRESLQHLRHHCAIVSGYIMRALKLEVQLFALFFLQVGMFLYVSHATNVAPGAASKQLHVRRGGSPRGGRVGGRAEPL